jgi:hypothetical protein
VVAGRILLGNGGFGVGGSGFRVSESLVVESRAPNPEPQLVSHNAIILGLQSEILDKPPVSASNWDREA